MHQKNSKRLKKATKTRIKLRQLAVPSLSVHKSNQHIYAQVFSADGLTTLASASTKDKGLIADDKSGCNIEAAQAVGKAIAEKAKKAGVESVGFDRSGYRYHGKVKALAEAAREAGLKF
ncbi:50S ribosomal protein L18 [Marinicella sp. S6413]|uniref:50S ribosomal protein L18 n=1 Tax=Marinicella gelatinilytica TaxID=2996017 RepID=UPI002260C12C|nr:50S ribosomal protein L18 [Marinicella gelatinilytica]MCX7546169.1 50S ribosomal protein L18 [Marinicella gelatinilytica]